MVVCVHDACCPGGAGGRVVTQESIMRGDGDKLILLESEDETVTC